MVDTRPIRHRDVAYNTLPCCFTWKGHLTPADENNMKTSSEVPVPALTCALVGFVVMLCAANAAQTTEAPTPAANVAASQVVNLPQGKSMDSWEHIFWDPSKGQEPDPADCKALKGMMEGPPGIQRCFISIKAWLALAPGNVIGELCVPGQGRAIPALLRPEDVQNLRARNLLVWTNADAGPFGYEQGRKCNGK